MFVSPAQVKNLFNPEQQNDPLQYPPARRNSAPPPPLPPGYRGPYGYGNSPPSIPPPSGSGTGLQQQEYPGQTPQQQIIQPQIGNEQPNVDRFDTFYPQQPQQQTYQNIPSSPQLQQPPLPLTTPVTPQDPLELISPEPQVFIHDDNIVFIRKPKEFYRKKFEMLRAGPSALQVHTDFEHVLTKNKLNDGGKLFVCLLCCMRMSVCMSM